MFIAYRSQGLVVLANLSACGCIVPGSEILSWGMPHRLQYEFRELQPAPNHSPGTSRPHVKNEAVQLQTESEAVRPCMKSEPVLLRTNPESPERGAKPRIVQL